VWYWEPEALFGFVSAIAVTLLVAGLLLLAGRAASDKLYQREALGLVGLSWISASVVAALPYWFSGELTLPFALFEATSGITTTGASILDDIEPLPQSLLFWRGFTQWLGGMGIILLFIAILPYLGAGGKQLFRGESSGLDPRSLKPRIRETAAVLWTIYLMLTLANTVLLMLGGMDFFYALCHTFSAVSTGGFSPHNESIAWYNSLYFEIVLIFFMVIAGTNFSLFFDLRNGDFKALLRDPEWRTYIALLGGGTLLVALNLSGWIGASIEIVEGPGYTPLEKDALQYGEGNALRVAAFQVVSIMTGTGFATDDFNEWPALSRMILFFLMFVGGCAGSTSGGLKVVRVLLMLKIAYWRLEKTFRPKTIRAVRLGGAIIDDETQRTMASFMVIYGVWIFIGCLLLSMLGVPFETTVTAVVTTINIVGPGLALVGPDASFSVIPDIGKLYLCLLMILGRLELFAVTVLFVPAFWRIGR
jgi:trk system potassium uptake protein TrkH